jgi:hypothetical protein
MKSGCPFTIIAMNDNKPVELYHEWSVKGIDWMLDLHSGKGITITETRAGVEEDVKHPIIWADTGKSIHPYRYYLTKADLRKINSMPRLEPGEGHLIRVKILKDDPQNKRQTLQVIVNGDLNRFKNIYEVKNDRVKPLEWVRYRPLAVTLIVVTVFVPLTLIIIIVMLLISAYKWISNRCKP